MLRPRSQCTYERTCICLSGRTAFYLWYDKFFLGKALRTLLYVNRISGRWCPQERLVLLKSFVCFLFSTLLGSVPRVLHRCSGTLQPLFHLLGIVKCGPCSSGILYLLTLYNVQSHWHSGIGLVSVIVHIIHHHSTVIRKFY